jgi:hypothetical protein
VKAVCHARVMGPHKHRTPSGHPILISTPIFDDAEMTPVEAMARRAHRHFGIVPHLSHWTIIATYDVKPDTRVKVTEKGKQPRVARAQYDVVYVLEFTHERSMRAHLKISDDCLNPFVQNPSWYLTPRTEDQSNN